MSRTAEQFNRRPNLPDTHSVDNRVYSDPEIFREEHDKILSKIWKFVAHESEIAQPNDYRTTTVAGTPLVVARGRDVVIRTFVNACSHHGAQILKQPRGNAEEFECLFHRWIYDGTSGECIAIPRPKGSRPAV
jgi:methanesulfonate monooxygenase large subunit